MNNINMPKLVDMMPRDSVSMPRQELDNLISVLDTGLEIGTTNALNSAASYVKQKLEMIAYQNEIGDFTNDYRM